MEQFNAWMLQQEKGSLWVSFDVDVLDPSLAMGTGTPVPGGLNYREAGFCAKWLFNNALASSRKQRSYQLIGVDMVEVNPLLDHQNKTSLCAVDWLSFLLGKKTV